MSKYALSKKVVIAVDMDDVLLEFNRAFIDFKRRVYGKARTFEEITSFKLTEIWDIEEDALEACVLSFFDSPEGASMVPVRGSLEAVGYLTTHTCMHVVTARSERFIKHSHAWIDMYHPGCFSGIHHTNGFLPDVGMTYRSKLEVCREIGASVLIDDALPNVEDVAKGGLLAILLDRPWNRAYTPEGVVRAYDWMDAVEIVRERCL